MQRRSGKFSMKMADNKMPLQTWKPENRQSFRKNEFTNEIG